MISFIFYFFSLILSYFDFKKFIVPNEILITGTICLLLFGSFYEYFTLFNFLIPIIVFVGFILLLLIKPNMVLGGGDIKFMMFVGLYLNPLLFPMFLVITGLLQTFWLVYKQNIKKEEMTPMVPPMILSVFITEILFYFDLIY